MSTQNRAVPETGVVQKSFGERVAEARREVPAISPQEAHLRQGRDPEVVFVDPRDAESIAATTGMIPGALNVPLARLNEATDTNLPSPLSVRTRTIVAACQAGPMGALAAFALKKRCYTHVYFMEGGTQGWLDAGFSTQR